MLWYLILYILCKYRWIILNMHLYYKGEKVEIKGAACPLSAPSWYCLSLFQFAYDHSSRHHYANNFYMQIKKWNPGWELLTLWEKKVRNFSLPHSWCLKYVIISYMNSQTVSLLKLTLTTQSSAQSVFVKRLGHPKSGNSPEWFGFSHF